MAIEITTWALVGVLMGWLPRALFDKRPLSLIISHLLGAIGGAAGGFISLVIQPNGLKLGGLHLFTVIGTGFGAMFCVFIYVLFSNRWSTHRSV